MALGIGGAETHIVELSKELSRRGYEVIIASNGGIYVEEIRRYGIRHSETVSYTHLDVYKRQDHILLGMGQRAGGEKSAERPRHKGGRNGGLL